MKWQTGAVSFLFCPGLKLEHSIAGRVVVAEKSGTATPTLHVPSAMC